ncbi:MAG: dienelactone hydrolase family protein [Bauldia sp.]|nr:dienelactone hydrolase family protein [Bauldia sp.]
MLDGPRLAPRSGGPARHLVVLLHGYGADGNDLIALGEAWAPLLPDAAFVSPHAPEPYPHAAFGRQWFPLFTREPDDIAAGVKAAAPALHAFLDAELQASGLGNESLALVGFSQGTMMALYAAGDRPAPAGILGYSGLVAWPVPPAAGPRPPVLLIHGADDPLISAAALPAAADALRAAGFPVETELRPGVGHGIDPAGLEHGGRFLRRVLNP